MKVTGITFGFATAISSLFAVAMGLSTSALASEYRICFDAKKMEHSLDGNGKKKGEYTVSWKAFESEEQEPTFIVPLNSDVVEFLDAAIKDADDHDGKYKICLTGSASKLSGWKTIFAYRAE